MGQALTDRARTALQRVMDGLEYVARRRVLDVIAAVLAIGAAWYAVIFGGLAYQLRTPAFSTMLQWAPGPPAWAPYVWATGFAAGALFLAIAAWREQHHRAAVGCILVGIGFVAISVAHVATWFTRPTPTGIAAYSILAALAGTLALLYAVIAKHEEQ